MSKNNSFVKYGCYLMSISMATVSCLSPLLLLTFRTLYGISFSLLGLLVLINFFTQLVIDLVFSFFSHRFNIEKSVKYTPLICVIGLLLYSLSPIVFKNSIYIGLVISTVIFSCASGLAEVLLSPVIAALPSDNPEREMSRFHSVFSWGCVFIVVFVSCFVSVFGNKSWPFLSVLLALFPFFAFLLLSFSKLPEMKTPQRASAALYMQSAAKILSAFYFLAL